MDWRLINWGESFWRCFHYLAIHEKRDIIEKLPEYIPCKTCKDEFVGVGSNEDLVDWSIREHNRVNGKLGKWDKWDRRDFDISHKPECDICQGKEHVFGFPWHFLNTISIGADGDESGESVLTSNTSNTSNTVYTVYSSNMAEQFIQEFVANYPCDICRGKLIIDIPEAEETHRGWVHRNHVRFNQERGLPAPLPLAVNIGTDAGSSNITTGCAGCPVAGVTGVAVAVDVDTTVAVDVDTTVAVAAAADVPVAASTDTDATPVAPADVLVAASTDTDDFASTNTVAATTDTVPVADTDVLVATTDTPSTDTDVPSTDTDDVAATNTVPVADAPSTVPDDVADAPSN
jgi:hypothetical protein